MRNQSILQPPKRFSTLIRIEFSCNLWWNYAEKCNKISSTMVYSSKYFLFSYHLSIFEFSSNRHHLEWLLTSRLENDCRLVWFSLVSASKFPVINFTRIIYLKCHFRRRDLEKHWKKEIDHQGSVFMYNKKPQENTAFDPFLTLFKRWRKKLCDIRTWKTHQDQLLRRRKRIKLS